MANSLLNQNKMEAKILKQEKNPFLKREEFTIEITSEANPVEAEIIEFIGKDAESTVVRTISSNFGSDSFLADVVVYDSAEAKTEVMTIPQKVRKKMEAEKKKAEEAAKAEAEAAKKAEEEAKAAAEEAKKAEEETKEEAPAEESEVPAESPKDDSSEPEAKTEEKTE